MNKLWSNVVQICVVLIVLFFWGFTQVDNEILNPLSKSISSRVPESAPGRSFFFIQTAVFGPAVPPIPRFCPDLGFHPSGEPRPSPAFALGDSERNKNA
jgi:hypothetical protein